MDNSRLLNLPPELRNEIYKYVLCTDDATVVSLGPTPQRSMRSIPHPRARKEVEQPCQSDIAVALALTRTCKQLRAESFPIFLRGNDFRIVMMQGPWIRPQEIGDPRTCSLLLRGWLSCLGGFSPCLKRVTLQLKPWIAQHKPVRTVDAIKGFRAAFKAFNCDPAIMTRIYTGYWHREGQLTFIAQLAGGSKEQAVEQLENDIQKTRTSLLEKPQCVEAEETAVEGYADVDLLGDEESMLRALQEAEQNLLRWKAWVESVLELMYD